jgi:hypothetical protein
MAGRPYGFGTYGTGRYGVGPTGVYFELAAQSSIRLAVSVKPTMLYAVGGAASITLQSHAAPTRIWMPAAATRISFSVRAVNPLRVVPAAGQTQISFMLRGTLVKTWLDDPAIVPCEPGTWAQQSPPWVERMAA